MTTIAGGIEDSKVFLAADTQVVDDNYYAAYDAQKLVRKGNMLIGIAGDYRASVALDQAPLAWLSYVGNPKYYMALHFANTMHQFFEKFEIEIDDFEALIGTKGLLFYYQHNECHVSPAGLYSAVGSGGPFALGSLHQTGRGRPIPMETRLREAISAGVHFDTQSGGEVAVLSI